MRHFFTCLMLGLLTQTVYGAYDFTPVQERAQGHSLAGATLLNDSLYSNPAASAFTSVYSVEGIYAAPKAYSVSVLDTNSSGMGGALGYFRQPIGGNVDPIQGIKLNLLSKVSRVIGVGLGGKLLWGPNQLGVHANLKDVDLGCLVQMQIVSFGLTIRNILGGDETLGQDQEVSLGGRVNFKQMLFFSAALHAKWEGMDPYKYGFGAEYVSPYHFSIKGGYRFQPDLDRSYWSTGASFISPRVSVHYALVVPNQDNEETEHTLGFTFLL